MDNDNNGISILVKMSKLARKFLCGTPTTVHSERLFSNAEQIDVLDWLQKELKRFCTLRTISVLLVIPILTTLHNIHLSLCMRG